jgi:hypothetical protein
MFALNDSKVGFNQIIPEQILDLSGNAVVSGRVGVATTNPRAPLDVVGSATVSAAVCGHTQVSNTVEGMDVSGNMVVSQNVVVGNTLDAAPNVQDMLPKTYSVYVDVFTSQAAYVNQVSMWPTFDTANRALVFNASRRQFLDLGPRRVNLASQGFTALVKFQFTGTPAFYERVWELYANGNNFISLYRHSTNAYISFPIRQSASLVGQVNNPSSTFPQGQTVVVATRFDPSGNVLSLWLNGTNIASGSQSGFVDTTYSNTYLGRRGDAYTNMNLFAFVLYDRPLRDEEIAQASRILSFSSTSADVRLQTSSIIRATALQTSTTSYNNIAQAGDTTIQSVVRDRRLTTTPVVRLESKDLVLTSGGAVAAWGPFTQGTSANRPVYFSTGGLHNGSYVNFTSASSQFLTGPTLNFDISTNGGLTVFALVRFLTSGDQRIFDFNTSSGTGSSNRILLYQQGGRELNFFAINATTGMFLPAVIIEYNQWAVYAVHLGATTGSQVCFYRNGQLLKTDVTTININNITPAFNSIGRRSTSATGYMNGGLGALFVYDRLLDTSEFQAVNSYLMQGAATLNAETMVTTYNPFNNATGGLARVPAYTVDHNVAARMHCLPASPMLFLDCYTPRGAFVNDPTRWPTFDTAAGIVSFNSSLNQCLDFGTLSIPLNTRGFTAVVKLRASGTAPTAQFILDLGTSPTVNRIAMSRLGTNLSFQILTASTLRLDVSYNVVLAEETAVYVARYDSITRTATVFKNGTLLAITAVTGVTSAMDATSTAVGSTCSTYTQPFQGALFALAVYDRALTNDEVATAVQVLGADVVGEGTLAVGSRVGEDDLMVGRDGATNAVAMSVPVVRPHVSHNLTQTTNGSQVVWQGGNLVYGTNPVVRLEARDLAGIATGTAISNWGIFSQGTGANQPLYQSVRGYNDGSFVQFNASTTTHFLQNTSSLTFNIGTNGGFTAVVLARFDGGTFWDRIFMFNAVNWNTAIQMGRNNNLQEMLIAIGNGTAYNSITVPINNWEWAVWSFTVGAASGSAFNVYKNGVLVRSTTTTIALANLTYSDHRISRDEGGTNGKVSIGAIFAYDRLLPPDELNALTGYLLQSNLVMNILHLSPLVPSLDANASVTTRALPPNPMFVVDAYAPQDAFLPLPFGTFPTFDTNNGEIVFDSGQYLSLGPKTFNVQSRGLTIVMRFKMRGTPANYETFLNFGSGNATANYIDNIGIVRVPLATNNLRFNVFNGATGVGINSVSAVPQETIVTVTARATAREMSLWINGVQEASQVPSIVFADRTTAKGYIAGSDYNQNGIVTPASMTLYCLAVYNRALTDDEIRQAHYVLSTETPYRSLEMASRAGEVVTAVDRTGVTSVASQATTSLSTIASHDLTETTQGETYQWTSSGMRYAAGAGLPPKVRLEAKDLGARLNSGDSVASWGDFFQTTASKQPTFVSTGGYQNGAYVRFSRGAFTQDMTGPSITYNHATNGGLTFMVLMRFEDINITDWGPVFVAPGFFELRRRFDSNVVSIYLNGEPTNTAPRSVTAWEWALYTVTVTGSTVGSPIIVRRNNMVLFSTTTTVALTDFQVNNNRLGTLSGGTNPLEGSIAALYVYDRPLPPDEYNALTGYLLQGAATLNGAYNLMTLNPFATMLGQPNGNAVRPANMDYNASLRVHTLPPNPMFVVDAFSPPSMFYNTTLPTFDQSNNYIQLVNANGTGPARFINVGPRTFNMVSKGFTAVTRIMSNVTFRIVDRILQFSSGTPNNLIALIFTNNQSLRFVLRDSNGNNELDLYSASGTVPFNHPLTVVTRISNGIATLWVDGVRVATGDFSANVSDRSISACNIGGYGDTAGMFDGLIYCVACYDRALTDEEIRHSHYVLSSDTTYAPLEVGSLTGNPILQLLHNGNMMMQGCIAATNLVVGRNKVINGDMRIDQRRDGTGSVTSYAQFQTIPVVDGWHFYQSNVGRVAGAQSTDAPPGFANSLSLTMLVQAFQPIYLVHTLEGYLLRDLGFGTNTPQPIMLSFWVKSNVSGTYPVCLTRWWGSRSRFYVTTYDIMTADTWEYTTVRLIADTASGYNLGNEPGVSLVFTVGTQWGFQTSTAETWGSGNALSVTSTSSAGISNTAGGYVRITGVQLEKGTVATPFEQRPYAQELQYCQRFFYPIKQLGSGITTVNAGYVQGTATAGVFVCIPDTLRTNFASGGPTANLFIESDAGCVNSNSSWLVNSTAQDNAYMYTNIGGTDYYPISISCSGRSTMLKFNLNYRTSTFTSGQVGLAGETWTTNNTNKWWGISADWHLYGLSATVLDNLTSGARTSLVGAYSVWRLAGNYYGPTVRIRRSTDNATADFYADPSGNLGQGINGSGTSLTTWLGAATGFVTIWYDQSGAGNNATQTTTASQPKIDSTNKWIDFSGNLSFNLPDGTVPFNNSNYTVTVRHNNISEYGGWLGSGTYFQDNLVNAFRSHVTGYVNIWWSNDIYIEQNTRVIGNRVTFKYDGSNRYGYVNGTLNVTQASSNRASTAINNTIGVTRNSEFLNGELYYLFIFNSALSDADRAVVEY